MTIWVLFYHIGKFRTTAYRIGRLCPAAYEFYPYASIPVNLILHVYVTICSQYEYLYNGNSLRIA